MAYNTNGQEVISPGEKDPETLANELMLARKEVLLLREQNEALKVTNIRAHNDLIQARNDRDQIANLLRDREEELEVANIDRDLFRRHLTVQGSVTDYLNDCKHDLLEAVAAKETQFWTVTKLCRKTFQQAFELRKRAIEAKEENELATQRMWNFSNESNAMARKLKRWRKRARTYKAALKVQKMRGLVFRKTMRAKLDHLMRVQKEGRQAVTARRRALLVGSQDGVNDVEHEGSMKIQD